MKLNEISLNEKIERSPSFELKDSQITGLGNIVITFSENQKSLRFINVTFEQPLILRNLNFAGAISFLNCHFHGGILFNNCKITLNQGVLTSHSLHFYKCYFNDLNIKIENECSFDSNVEIENVQKLKNIYLNNTNFSSFQIKDSAIFDFIINKNNFNSLRIEGCIVNGQIRQSLSTYAGLTWMNSEFKKDIFLKDDLISGYISIQDNIFNEFVFIDPYIKTLPDSTLTIISNKFKKNFSISYYKKVNAVIEVGGVENIYLYSNEFDDGLTITGDILNTAIKLKSLMIDISNSFIGLLKISEFHIEHLNITGENYKGNIILNSLWIKKLEILNFANYSSFQFIKCHALDKSSSFKIYESYLEKFQFTGCFLDEFFLYDIESSNLSLIKSSNTQWFSFEQLEKNKVSLKNKSKSNEKKPNISIENTRIYLEIRDTFRQLKYAMEQQGDKVNALTFKSYEMEAYLKYLKLNHGFLQRDRLILLLGKTNSHGINWKIPLLYICGLTFLFYGIIFFEQSPKYYIGGNHWMISDFLKDIWINKKVVPQMLNPIHKVEDLFLGKNFPISGWTYAVDFLYKIIFSFFVFQLISAFRKFVK